MEKKFAVISTLLVGALFGAVSHAQVAFYANIAGVAATGDLFGGCIARTNPAPQNVAGLEACGNNFVSFDCNNDSGATSKSAAASMYSNAQLSMVTGGLAYITVDPTVKLNNRCLAVSIESQPVTP